MEEQIDAACSSITRKGCSDALGLTDAFRPAGLRYAAAKYTFDYVFRVDNDAYLRIDEFVRSMVPKLPQKRLYLGNFLASNKAGPLWHNYWVCRAVENWRFPVS